MREEARRRARGGISSNAHMKGRSKAEKLGGVVLAVRHISLGDIGVGKYASAKIVKKISER